MNANQKKLNILIVEDSETDTEIARQALNRYMAGPYSLRHAQTAADAADIYNYQKTDLILLDLGLPDDDGLSVLSRIREKSGVPVIILSGNDSAVDRVIGIEMGADDYMTKPYEMRELYARIKAVLRRTQNQAETSVSSGNEADDQNFIRFEDWILDKARYEIYDSEGVSAGLTTTEFKLLEALVTKSQCTLSRDQLFDMTRGMECGSYDRAIDIMIGRIRKKLGDDAQAPKLIKTIRGIGYMFCAETEEIQSHVERRRYSYAAQPVAC